MNIGDEIEVRMTGKLVRIEQDIFDPKRVLFTVKDERNQFSVTVPEEAIVNWNAANLVTPPRSVR